MPFDRLPGAPGGNTHFLVVIALTAAGGEGIAQPEAVLGCQCVSYIGKGGRTFVGGDHQIGIIAVVSNHIFRRHHLAVIEVVRDVEQPPDEGLIAGNAFLPQSLP